MSQATDTAVSDSVIRIATGMEVSLKLIEAAPTARNVIAQGNALGQHADVCLSAESAK
jgi:hypothetical protein